MSYVTPFKRFSTQSNRFTVLDIDKNNVQPTLKPMNNRFDVLVSEYNEKTEYNRPTKNFENRRNNRFDTIRYNLPYKREIKKPEFILDADCIQKEFPTLPTNNINTINVDSIDKTNSNEEKFTDIVRKEKEVVIEIIKEKPNDVRSIVNELKQQQRVFEERRYDSNGWMDNEDWLEWYEFYYKY